MSSHLGVPEEVFEYVGEGWMHPVVEAASQVVSQLAAVDWAQLPSAEVAEAVLVLGQVRSVVGAAELAALGQLDGTAWLAEQGFRSARGWLIRHGRRSPWVAGRLVADARGLAQMPVVADAVAAGEVGLEQVSLLRRACSPERREAFAGMEATFVDIARRQPAQALTRAVQYWVDACDPLAAEDRVTAQVAGRSVEWSTGLEGMGRLEAALDPETSAVVGSELARLEQLLFEVDWREARCRLGAAATTADLGRTPAQRRADALRLMAERSAGGAGGDKGTVPTVVLHLDWQTFIAELAAYRPDHPYLAGGDTRAAAVAAAVRRGVDPAVAEATGGRLCEYDDGTVTIPSAALSAALRGRVQRLVFDPDGHVLDLGRSRRTFTGGLRRALIYRDRTCDEDGCGLPARHCEGDHITPWALGGTTSEANGRMCCDHHNRRRPPHPGPSG